MKRLLFALFFIASLVPCTANVVCQQSSPHNMLVRVEGNYRYLLLPIQDNGPEYRVQLIENNQLYRTLILRLATEGKVDFYVPLDLKDINIDAFHMNVRMGDQKIAWNDFKVADTFDSSNTDYYRPLFHHTPAYGWMNDPNGMFYDEKNGLWHLYYQYNPYASKWQNMTWGHSTSSDLIHWESHPLALEVDVVGAIFSGSCVVDKNNTAGFGENAVVAFYTSAAESQAQSMAYSLDGGKTFIKYPGNPIIVSDIVDFRDPKVWWNEATEAWNMALACGQEMRFYASKNLKNWEFLSAFGEGVGCHGGVWECPDMLRVRVRNTNDYKWVLLCNINPGGPAGGSATQYFVGDWDGQHFVPVVENGEVSTKWMDYGKDHYATVSFAHAPADRTTVMVWMSNWQYANDVPTMQFRSANALPRDIDLYRDSEGIYRIGVKASPEVAALKGKVVGKGTTVKTVPATAVIEVEVSSSKRPATITLSNEKGEEVVMTYDFQAQTFSMDRTKAGLSDFSRDFSAKTTTPLFVSAKKHKVIIYLDKCSIEAFDAQGNWAMTNLVFPTTPYNQLSVLGGKASVYSINY